MASDPILTAERVNRIVAGYVERGELWNASLEALARSHEALRTERDALVVVINLATAFLKEVSMTDDFVAWAGSVEVSDVDLAAIVEAHQ